MILRNWSDSLELAGYRLVAFLFLRLLALIYLTAFASIGVQIPGLAGAEGILPFAEQLQFLLERHGTSAYWLLPNLFWLHAGDGVLQGVAAAGCLFSLLLFFAVWVRLSLIALFVCYLSLFHAGQLFMNFQWDYLLLEAGFLAIFLPRGSRLVVWLLRWLLFRLRFLSGASKLLSGDPSWASLTALNFYFETQPLPHWLAWYTQYLPERLLQFGTGTVLFIEIIVPFMMFMNRPLRFFAAWVTILLQLLIILTSNHNFFNLLTILLCLFLFDDKALRSVLPKALLRWVPDRRPDRDEKPQAAPLVGFLGGIILFVSSFQIWEMFSGRRSPEPVARVTGVVNGFRIVNKYHVFPVIKTQRKELIIEGSMDGEHWQAYRFRYKPGDPARRPEMVIPHQPRLDWMMWFVPGGHPMNMMWFDLFLHRLLENSAPVVDLLENNPFPDRPPRYIRTWLYQYRFSDRESRKQTGRWWERERLGPFYPWPWMVGPVDSG